MHQIETLVSAFHYGFSKTSFFVRFDCRIDFSIGECEGYTFSVQFFAPKEYKLVYCCKKEGGCLPNLSLLKMNENEIWEKVKEISTFGVNKILEVGISFADIEANPGDQLQFGVIVEKDGNELERWPRGGMLTVCVPTENYELEQWSI